MIISKRAKEISDKSLHGKINPQFSEGIFEWKISCDKNLTVSYISCPDLVHTILLETTAYLLNYKNCKNLFMLNYREVESFLRDSNEIPAFKGLEVQAAEVIFEKILGRLHREFIKFHSKKVHEKTNFIDRNKYWADVFAHFDGIEFALSESEMIYFHGPRMDSIVSFDISE